MNGQKGNGHLSPNLISTMSPRVNSSAFTWESKVFIQNWSTDKREFCKCRWKSIAFYVKLIDTKEYHLTAVGNVKLWRQRLLSERDDKEYWGFQNKSAEHFLCVNNWWYWKVCSPWFSLLRSSWRGRTAEPGSWNPPWSSQILTPDQWAVIFQFKMVLYGFQTPYTAC